MNRLKRFLGTALLLGSGAPLAADLPLESIRLPPGFSIEVWTRIENPRQMALGRHDERGGTLFVGSMQAGKVHAVRYGADFRAAGTTTVAKNLARPVGMARISRRSPRLRAAP